MRADVYATVWGQLSDNGAPAQSGPDIEDQAHQRAGLALARETPGAIEVRTCVLSQDRLVNDVVKQGYCITTAVRVQRDTFALNDHLELLQQVQRSLEGAVRDLFSLIVAEGIGSDPERRG